MNNPDMDERLKLLQEKRNQAQAGGGLDRLEKHRQAGKLTARERIEYLLDPRTFREIHMFAETQCFEFDMQKKKVLGDGVITGFGTIAGRTVMVYSQDATVFGGSCGRAHGQKVCNIIRMARKSGVPIIGLNDTGGGRLQEGMDNVAGYGEMFFENTVTSGVVPQIAAIMGPCTGGGVYSPALMDFILQVEGTAQMFISTGTPPPWSSWRSAASGTGWPATCTTRWPTRWQRSPSNWRRCAPCWPTTPGQ